MLSVRHLQHQMVLLIWAILLILPAVIGRGMNAHSGTASKILDSSNYSLYFSGDRKPLLICLPGSDESIQDNPLYTYIQCGELEPDCNIIFFNRPYSFAHIDSEYVRQVINSIPHTKLYYFGFSLGAWQFSDYLDCGDFNGAILIDGYDISFRSETCLEKVIVVQAHEHYISQYEAVLSKMDCEYEIYDLTAYGYHVESMWWAFAPSDEVYFHHKRRGFGQPVLNLIKEVEK